MTSSVGPFAWQAWRFVTSSVVSRGRRGAWRHPPSFCVAGVYLWDWAGSGDALERRWAPCGSRPFCVAGVALRDILRRFTWQAWRLATSTFVLRGRRGTYVTELGLVTRLGAVGRRVVPRPFCVAGVALRDILRRFTWQAWHLATSTFVLRGRRGTYVTGLGLVTRLGVVGRRVVRGPFAWQAWHLVTSSVVSRGRRGTWRHQPSFCVAGVGLIGLGWVW